MTRRFTYGPAPEQFATLDLPDTAGPHRVVTLIHGGFWRAQYELDLMEPLAADLAARGFAVWNIEYRRVAQRGGGYPGTLTDVAAAVDLLASVGPEYDLDVSCVAVAGHSAGGHLALWVGSRHLLAEGAPGAQPAVRPSFVIGLAAVADLPGAATEGLGKNATQDFMGGEPAELPEEYAIANPVVGERTTLIHGDADDVVPVDQSTRYADAAEVIIIDGEAHMDVIDPTSRSWAATVDVLSGLLGGAPTKDLRK